VCVCVCVCVCVSYRKATQSKSLDVVAGFVTKLSLRPNVYPQSLKCGVPSIRSIACSIFVSLKELVCIVHILAKLLTVDTQFYLQSKCEFESRYCVGIGKCTQNVTVAARSWVLPLIFDSLMLTLNIFV
jgi:hypothetical protein